jgi:LysM repeat protein
VEVPVIEFSSIPEKFELKPFVKTHTIETGDTVSKLLGKQFFSKNGMLSREAQKAFTHLNPKVTNIDLIYQGTQLVIPDPSILSQPWFKSFLQQGSNGIANAQNSLNKTSASRLPVISSEQMTQLKRYSELIQGTLINQGKMHFPGHGAQPDLSLDLTQTPLIENKDGLKTLIIPRDDKGRSLGADLVENIRAYWKQIKVQELDDAISMAEELAREKTSLADRPVDTDKFIVTLLSVTQIRYISDEIISFTTGSIEMTGSFGRIRRPGQPDLLINTGSVYGLALETIEKKGNQVLTIAPGLTMSELIVTLFTRLGYSIWENPSFTKSGRVETIQGIYVKKDREELLFTRQKPTTAAISFLETENIQFLILNQ